MLGKLMKYELRATGRIALPCFLLVLVLAGLTRLSAAYMLDKGGILSLLGGIIIFLFVIACIALSVLTLVLTIQRFRNNLLGDEGYLMHTLPVTASANIFAKLLSSLIWYAGSALVGLLAVVVLTVQVDALQELSSFFRDFMEVLTPGYAAHGVLWALEFVLLVAAALGAFSLMVYASLSLGHRAQSRRTLASFGCFCGIYILTQIVSGLLTVLFFRCVQVVERADRLGLELFGILQLELSHVATVHVFLLGGILISVVYGAIMYWITAANLKKHLNLE